MATTFAQNLKSIFTDASNAGFPPAGDQAALKLRFDSAANGPSADIDRKAAVDQSFRDVLIGSVIADIRRIGPFVDYAIAACRADVATATLPVVLMSDVFDVMALNQCESIFQYVEDNVAVWREDWMFAACKNNLLRMCNDLLRRLSRSQNTVFCGRILLFLAKFFPFSERSGLNVVSEFNLENLTEFEASSDGESASASAVLKDDGMKDATVAAASLTIDHSLYCKFWALQDFFRNPNQCYNKAQWESFAGHASSVLAAFTSFKLDETTIDAADADASSVAMEVDEKIVRESSHFFAKFLTNPKLLALQLSDSNFRRSVLVQFLILFQYLRSTVKFKAETFNLTSVQLDYIADTDATVYRLLHETPPNGAKFAATVRHMLEREDMWNNWKNDGCKEFRRPVAVAVAVDDDAAVATSTASTAAAVAAPAPPTAKQNAAKRRAERRLGDLVHDSIAQKRFYMGSPELTRLWNICPDNLQACRGEDRNFLPSIETYLENPKDKTDPSFEWRALRLLARQSPHFFSLTLTPNKVSDYLEGVRKKIHESKSKAAPIAPQAGTTATTTAANVAAAANGQQPTTETKPKSDIVVDLSAAANVVSTITIDDEPMAVGAAASASASVDDDHNAHRSSIATDEQLTQVAIIIGAAWRQVAPKLGQTPDVIKFIDEKPKLTDKCFHMLRIWFDEDEDASLDNLAYMLEGMEMVAAAEAIKRIVEPADKMDDVSE